MNQSNKRIYVSSRTYHAPMWQEHRLHGWPITSSWIDYGNANDEDLDLMRLWDRIEREILDCDAFIFYAEEADFPFKGALIEAGIALACHTPVYAVLKTPLEGKTFRPVGSWIMHRGVYLMDNLQSALDASIGISFNPLPKPSE